MWSLNSDQKDEKNSKNNFTRYVSDIISPSMSFNNISINKVTANIVSIYIEYMNAKNNILLDNFVIVSGIAVLDLVTGETTVSEFYSKDNNETVCLQEIYRFLTMYYPKEIIINVNDLPDQTTEIYSKHIEKVLELKRYDRYVIHVNKVKPEFKKLNYQTDFFNKLFVNNNYIQVNNKIIQELNLSKYNYGRLAYILLIQFCNLQQGSVENLKPPTICNMNKSDTLILTHNSALCLEVIPPVQNKNKCVIDSLFAIMRHTCTNLGTRCLEHQLLNPMCKSNDIEHYYNMVEECLIISNEEKIWISIEKKLLGLPDIARLQRKLELKLITPREIVLLFKSYNKVVDLCQFLQELSVPNINSTINKSFNLQEFKQFVTTFNNQIDYPVLECCDYDKLNNNKVLEFTTNPFKTHEYFINQFAKLEDVNTKLEHIQTHLNSFLTKGHVKISNKHLSKTGKILKGPVKYENKSTLLLISPTDANKLLTCPINIEWCGKITISTFDTKHKLLTSDIITDLLQQKDSLTKDIGIKLTEYTNELVYQILSYAKFFTPVCNIIGLLDVIHTFAKLAEKNKYYRPRITHGDTSFLKLKNLRHPIAEKLIEGEYITNDINIGKNDITDDAPFGLLMYGINCAGKTSCLKGIGLVIIMAQSGSFVPANMVYSPYHNIVTRLTTTDNLFQGQSSFEVEMNELKTILTQSAKNTLVFADELASKTESHSAACITVAAIQELLALGVSFLFTSHIHHIVSLPHIASLPSNIFQIYHLAVNYDTETENLIYNRKLLPGSGSSRYGINVAKYLKLPQSFIDKANEVSMYIEQQNIDYLNTKSSHFNSKVYMDHCVICNATENLETHHIQEQKYADEQGYINHMHKNVKSNLLVLCEKCHRKITIEKKELEVLQTINGHIVKYK